jgi:hypothetical protein
VNPWVVGQNPEPRTIANPEPGVRIAQAVRADRAPRLDGTLDDPIWQQAPAITDFRQREPYEGQPATERTEVRVLYTRNEVYFGVVCDDSVENGPVATQLRRDVTQELDDYFEIVIDSRFDRRNAYVFQVNPLGTQRDALITDEQVGDTQDGDPGWDGVWISEARRTRDGWTATIAIPFSTLNFMRSRDVVWGVNFKRFIRRKNEEDQWSGWRRIFGASKISQAGELHGITEIGSGRLFIVKPYALGGFSHLPPNATASGLTPGTTGLYTGGVDVKIGLRSNLVANLTANTDFADSDVDVQQFNLTPYKLFFPEKRQFFLENAGVFAFPMGFASGGDQLFFSRQIGIDPVTGEQVPINGGQYQVFRTQPGDELCRRACKEIAVEQRVICRSHGHRPAIRHRASQFQSNLGGRRQIGFIQGPHSERLRGPDPHAWLRKRPVQSGRRTELSFQLARL